MNFNEAYKTYLAGCGGEIPQEDKGRCNVSKNVSFNANTSYTFPGLSSMKVGPCGIDDPSHADIYTTSGSLTDWTDYNTLTAPSAHPMFYDDEELEMAHNSLGTGGRIDVYSISGKPGAGMYSSGGISSLSHRLVSVGGKGGKKEGDIFSVSFGNGYMANRNGWGRWEGYYSNLGYELVSITEKGVVIRYTFPSHVSVPSEGAYVHKFIS